MQCNHLANNINFKHLINEKIILNKKLLEIFLNLAKLQNSKNIYI